MAGQQMHYWEMCRNKSTGIPIDVDANRRFFLFWYTGSSASYPNNQWSSPSHWCQPHYRSHKSIHLSQLFSLSTHCGYWALESVLYKWQKLCAVGTWKKIKLNRIMIATLSPFRRIFFLSSRLFLLPCNMSESEKSVGSTKRMEILVPCRRRPYFYSYSFTIGEKIMTKNENWANDVVPSSCWFDGVTGPLTKF